MWHVYHTRKPPLAPPKDGIAAYFFAANVARRHLTSDQRVMITALVEDFVPDDGFTGRILDENLVRAHYGPGQLRIADALIDEPDFPESLVLPEARRVAREPDLARQVGQGTLRLSDAYKLALEREQEAIRHAEEVARLRRKAPFLAVQVDEGTLTLEQAIVRADQDGDPLLAEHVQGLCHVRAFYLSTPLRTQGAH